MVKIIKEEITSLKNILLTLNIITVIYIFLNKRTVSKYKLIRDWLFMFDVV